jgi:hypothetical protein
MKPLTDRNRLLLTAFVLAAMLTGCILLIVSVVPPRFLNRLQTKWIRFGVVTVFFVCYTLKAYWKLRRRVSFWAIYILVLVIHIWGWGHFFFYGNGVSTVTFAVAGAAEFGCMGLVIYWTLGIWPDNVNLNLGRRRAGE